MSRAILLTGMHRSGTSLLASVLARSGVDMGLHLMPASRGNRRGHFEDVEFVRLHEAMLARRGAGAFTPPADAEATVEEIGAARALVAARAAKPLWGFKDPRACLFLDFWCERLPDPFFVFLYRHPIEVALSLLRRGLDLEVQLDAAVAVRAWTDYNARVLAFRTAHPERCLLWPAAVAVRSLAGAVGQLAERLGRPLSGEGVDDLLDAGGLRSGLAAVDVDWAAVIPQAMALFARLERVADSPPAALAAAERAAGPDPRERELLEASEHLLAAVLSSSGAPATPASAPPAAITAGQRIAFSELRLLTARQDEELARARLMNEQLRRRLNDLEEGWRRVEGTLAFRAALGYWRSAASVRRAGRRLRWNARRLGALGRPRPEGLVIGCVTENRPPMLAQAARLVRSIRWFGGALVRARVWVCAVEGIDPAARRDLESYGAEVRIVPRFDPRSPSGNKLQFLTAGLAEGADALLLVDCDTAVVGDPLPLLAAGALQARVADVPSVTADVFARLFPHFGLPLPRRRYTTTLLATPTLLYCNSGCVFLPAFLARDFVPAWREYNRRILDVLDLLGPCARHHHQAAFSLAHAACPVPFAEPPVAFNYPLHMTHLERPPEVLAGDPVVLHYHDLVDGDGCLLPSPYPRAQARIAALNRRLREETGEPAGRSLPLVARRVDRRPEVRHPAEEEEPEDGGGKEMEQGRAHPALEDLTEARDEEARESGDHVACRSLAGHGDSSLR